MGGMVKDAMGIKVRMNTDYDTAVAKTVEALKAEGFGVLTEIDVKETMKNKLGLEYAPFKILGACNPPLAHRALEISPDVGLLLPCNVTVRQVQGGAVEVALVDPMAMLGVVQAPELSVVAKEAGERLERVAKALES